MMKKTIVSLAAVASVSAVTATAVSAEEVTVNKGDTLWGIAQNHNVSVQDIKDNNGLNSNLIFPNQTLTVNGGNNNGQASSSSDVHKVVSGDTLFSIGQDNGVSVEQLQAWNNIDSHLIYPGEELSLQGSAVETSTEQSAPESHSSDQEAEAEQTSANPAGGDEAVKTMTMEATAYTAFCEGCSGTTATGIDLRANPDQKVIAVDPDVIPLGTEVYVEGYGKAVAGDTGGAIQGNRIDVYMEDRSDALDFGRKSVEVKVYE